MELVNCFESEGQWFKANLHCHTTTSDGDCSLAERVEQYRGQGYAILAVTDHFETNDVGGLSTDDFLVISGIELHPVCPDRGDNYHLVGLHVPVGFECPVATEANKSIEMVRQAGGEVMVAHPYWCGHNINHLLNLNGFIAVEVFNSTCAFNGKGCSSVQWDDLLDAGRVIPAVGVDDVHSTERRDIFRGWTMIRARELTVDAVMAAMRSGCYYSSCGPVIEDFRVVDGMAKVKCSGAVEIRLISQTSSGRAFFADDGELLTSAQRAVDDSLKYVRAEEVDDKGLQAWSNPNLL